ncbi:hypothetical protein [Massilia sp. TN1-12]|uniref:hypothetical protein n=1 Tax=Massilia paldalensis TaxID=3377675 RepID=UPI00384CC911
MNQDEITRALQEFVGAFEVVFRRDWEYTKIMIGHEADGANFLDPKLDDEFEDWGARGALLAKYRSLLVVMKRNSPEPVSPFPIHHVRPKHG